MSNPHKGEHRLARTADILEYPLLPVACQVRLVSPCDAEDVFVLHTSDKGMTSRDQQTIVLVCPRDARPGQVLYYSDNGKRCATTLPPGVFPGDRFRVDKVSVDDKTTSTRKLFSSHSTKLLQTYGEKHAATGTTTQKPKLQKSKSCANIHTTHDQYQRETKREDKLSPADRELFDAYCRRQRNGELGDDRWWGKQGFRSGPKEVRKRGSNGYGTPKWSPYYRTPVIVNHGTQRDNTPDPTGRKPDFVLGDQAWWAQYGFKGSISEQKKRDYGCGIPAWSPYYRSKEPGTDENDEPPVNLPPDAFWFKQWGFRTGVVSEEKKRNHGFGVPKWSPYCHPST